MRIRYSHIFNIYQGFHDETLAERANVREKYICNKEGCGEEFQYRRSFVVHQRSHDNKVHHCYNNPFAVTVASGGTTEVQRTEPKKNIVWEKARKRMPWWLNDVICGPPSTKMNHKQKNWVIWCWMGAQASLNRVNFKVDLFSMPLVFFEYSSTC